MAEDVVAGSAARPAAEHPAAERPAPSRAERAHSSAYYTRFSLAYMALIMLAVGGVGALILVLVHPRAAPSPPWSKFRPTGSSIAMERQIATRVSAEYKQSTTDKLVSVLPGPLVATRFLQNGSGGQTSVSVPITVIAVEPDVSTGQHEASDVTFLTTGSTVAYEMCGLASSQQNCGVASITGANPRGLLHREALELALYTLKYVPNTNAVVVYLPPSATPQPAATALLFARKDVKENLGHPLTRTLTPQQLLLGGPVPDGGRVGKLTRGHIFTSDYQTLPGAGTTVLVLTPTGAG